MVKVKYLEVNKEVLEKLESLNLSVGEMQDFFDIYVSKKSLYGYMSRYGIKHKTKSERLVAILGNKLLENKVSYYCAKYNASTKTIVKARKMLYDKLRNN